MCVHVTLEPVPFCPDSPHLLYPLGSVVTGKCASWPLPISLSAQSAGESQCAL